MELGEIIEVKYGSESVCLGVRAGSHENKGVI